MGKTLIKRYWPTIAGTITMAIDDCFCQWSVDFGACIYQSSSSRISPNSKIIYLKTIGIS